MPSAPMASTSASAAPLSAYWAPAATSRSWSTSDEPARLGEQLLVLARLRVDGGDLVQAVPQQVGLAGHLPRLLRALDQLRGHRDPLLTQLAVPAERLGDGLAGEPVQHSALFGGPGQPQLVVLPVHGDQLLGQLREHADRHGPAAQVGPGPAVAC